jgi:hypothetical protein
MTYMARQGLSANELARALISMMAPEQTNQRPDTLMRDRYRRIDELSCDARPDHTFGSISTDSPLLDQDGIGDQVAN